MYNSFLIRTLEFLIIPCNGQNSVIFIIKLAYKLSHDKDFTGHDGIISNQTSFSY
jgi:hypothetical protein